MPSNYYTDLFKQFLNGELSPEKTEELITWLGDEKLDHHASQLIQQQLNEQVRSEELSPELIQTLTSKLPAIFNNDEKPAAIVRHMQFYEKKWFRYAAAIVLILGAGTFFLLRDNTPKKSLPVTKISSPENIDIAPGKEGAILTLEDGSQMVLDSLGNGVITSQNGSKVLLDNGKLVYNADGSVKGEIAYNTISTPKGRQFQLVLPDQTKVWLNAASSLKYPTAFPGEERKVEITGEAYFEVAKNTKMPFRVHINDNTTVEVLGTHFNINSYANESDIRTTLLEGSVRIINGNENAVIKPGQQAKVNNGSAQHIQVVNAVDVDKVMAWKNGVFDFQDATLEEVMRQLERWYDIEVVYEKGVPEFEFVGKVGRDLSLSGVMRGLELGKVHCKLEGRKLIVSP